MAKILVAEDDPWLRGLLEDALLAEKHSVECVETGDEAASRMRFYKYDIFILDWNLPGMSGIDICKGYRGSGGTTPILMITGKKHLDEKATGFEAGADDYLTKPFDPRELSMRIKALLRRPKMYCDDVLKFKDLTLNCASHVLTRGDREVRLPPSEYQLLELLMRYPGKLFSAENIIAQLWPNDTEVSPNAVRIYVNRLRKKLDTDNDSSYIKTAHGMGYKLGDD